MKAKWILVLGVLFCLGCVAVPEAQEGEPQFVFNKETAEKVNAIAAKIDEVATVAEQTAVPIGQSLAPLVPNAGGITAAIMLALGVWAKARVELKKYTKKAEALKRGNNRYRAEHPTEGAELYRVTGEEMKNLNV